MVSTFPVFHSSGRYTYIPERKYGCVRKEEVEEWGLSTTRHCFKLGTLAFEQVTTALIRSAEVDQPQVNPSLIIHSTTTTMMSTTK